MVDPYSDPDRVSDGDNSRDTDGPTVIRQPVTYTGTPFYICPNPSCTACHINNPSNYNQNH